MAAHREGTVQIIQADARKLAARLPTGSIDLVVTSPPYWQCRDYNHPDQIGQEKTPDEYIETLITTLDNWQPLLRPHASIFLNLGDVFRNGSLIGLPAMLEVTARSKGWLITNRIIWSKDRGVPEPKPYRLASRHEYIYQFSLSRHFYFDLHALKEHLGHSANPGDVWHLDQIPSGSDHLAPFPPELVRRAILLACPEFVCPQCGTPYRRRLEPSTDLNPDRQQARRALELYENSHLTEEHLAAIRAVGISDAGKGQLVQNGTGKNAARTKQLAQEAKEVLGGYFREFTFASKRHVGWDKCECDVPPTAGTVLDPFMGSGTTLRVAHELGRNAVGADLVPPSSLKQAD